MKDARKRVRQASGWHVCDQKADVCHQKLLMYRQTDAAGGRRSLGGFWKTNQRGREGGREKKGWRLSETKRRKDEMKSRDGRSCLSGSSSSSSLFFLILFPPHSSLSFHFSSLSSYFKHPLLSFFSSLHPLPLLSYSSPPLLHVFLNSSSLRHPLSALFQNLFFLPLLSLPSIIFSLSSRLPVEWMN